MSKRKKKSNPSIISTDLYTGVFIDWVNEHLDLNEEGILSILKENFKEIGNRQNMLEILLGERFQIGGRLPTEEILILLKKMDTIRGVAFERLGEEIEGAEADKRANQSLRLLREKQIFNESSRIAPLMKAAEKKRDEAIRAAQKAYEEELANIQSHLAKLDEFKLEAERANEAIEAEFKEMQAGMAYLEEEDALSKAFQAQLGGKRHYVIIDCDFTIEMLVKAQFNDVVTTSLEAKKNPYLARVVNCAFNLGSPNLPAKNMSKNITEEVKRADAIAALVLRFHHYGTPYEVMLGKKMTSALSPFFREMGIPWKKIK